MNYAARLTPSAHDRRCDEPGCKSKVHARGACQKHYKQRYFDRRTNCVTTSRHHTGVVRVGVKGWGSLCGDQRAYWDVPF